MVETRAAGPAGRLIWAIVDFVRSPLKAEGDAWICTSQHVPVIYSGAPDPPPDSPHIDAELRLWSNNRRITVFELAGATINDVPLENAGNEKQITLEPGGPRATLYLELKPADDSPLTAAPGDKIKIRLNTSHGPLGKLGRPAVTLTLAPKAPGA